MIDNEIFIQKHKLLSSKQVAEILGVGVQSVSLYVKKGDIDYIRVGNSLKFTQQAVTNYLLARKNLPHPMEKVNNESN